MEQDESRRRGCQSGIGYLIDRDPFAGQGTFESVYDAGMITAGPTTFRVGE